jgi:hypothetical protein
MHQSRWGFHPCSFAEFSELRAVWRAVLTHHRQMAGWGRWNAKAPHNRVTRPRIRDTSGRVIGYGEAVPVAEPPLPACACRKVVRPSGKVAVEYSGPSGVDVHRLQQAYRLARWPRATPAEVEPLPVTMAEVTAWKAAIDG